MTSSILAGVDEVGRGCLAGPVISASVILADTIDLSLICDSKELKSQKREEIANHIIRNSVAVGIGLCNNVEIDKINIHEATLLSMSRSLTSLPIIPDKAIIDGLFTPNHFICCESVVKADKSIPVVSAASILAKVIRDNFMKRIDNRYDVYEFSKNKGYGTAKHIELLKQFGPSIYHRMTFSPLKDTQI